ncbi:MAG: DEAD/DEAH box helicase [Balneolaceae bacterium]
MSFSQLRISSDILKGLKEFGVSSPTPFQKKMIRAVGGNRDLRVFISEEDSSETGYLTPVLDEISRSEKRQGTRVVILTQNPERIMNLDQWIRKVGKHASIQSAAITEEDEVNEQKKMLASGPAIVVGSPKRLASLMEENRMVMRDVSRLILDRADRLENWDDVNVIVQRIIGTCRRTVISTPGVELPDMPDNFLTDPETIGEASVQPVPQEEEMSTETEQTAVEKQAAGKKQGTEELEIDRNLTQYYINVPPRMKITTLLARLDIEDAKRAVIFTASSRTADRLYRILRKNGRRAVSLHKSLDETTYTERFKRFTEDNVQHLVVSEFGAAELKIDSIPLVINYDVPEQVEEYKARADLAGGHRDNRIVSLVSAQDRGDIREIIENLGYAPEEIPLPEEAKKREEGRTSDRSKGGTAQKGRDNKEKRKQQAKEKRGRPSRPSRSSESGSQDVEEGSDSTLDLPRPSYDKLSGGRSGKEKGESGGITGFIKKLFS